MSCPFLYARWRRGISADSYSADRRFEACPRNDFLFVWGNKRAVRTAQKARQCPGFCIHPDELEFLMMKEFKIHTGHFAKAQQYESKGMIAISIARFPPKGFSVLLSYSDLAPTAEMLRMSQDQFMEKYQSALQYKNARKVVDDLRSLSGGIPVVLCCHEKPGESCHRDLVAAWIKEKTGITVDEFGAEPERTKTEVPVNGTLF